MALFGQNKSHELKFSKPVLYNNLMTFNSTCKKWSRGISKNPDTYKEEEKFKNTSIVTTMLEQISDRVGFIVDYRLAALMENMCIYERAWNESTRSPWCELFSERDFQIFGFIKDLNHYWKYGYGHSVSYQIACPILRNIFEFFSSKSDVKTSVRFAHAEGVMRILSLLGIAKDNETLRANSFNASKERQWKTSFISSFATNIALVSYDCESTGPSILTMHQERIVTLPGCPRGIPCPLNAMINMYDIIDTCNITELCSY